MTHKSEDYKISAVKYYLKNKDNIRKHDYEKIKSFLSNNNYELICNFSNYNKVTNVNWGGTHNDYLFKIIE